MSYIEDIIVLVNKDMEIVYENSKLKDSQLFDKSDLSKLLDLSKLCYQSDIQDSFIEYAELEFKITSGCLKNVHEVYNRVKSKIAKFSSHNIFMVDNIEKSIILLESQEKKNMSAEKNKARMADTYDTWHYIYLKDFIFIINKYFEVLKLEKSLASKEKNSSVFSDCECETSTMLYYKNTCLTIRMIEPEDDYEKIKVCFIFSDIEIKSKLINYDDKNVFKNLLINSITHELNTPLNFINLFSEGLLDTFNNKLLSLNPPKEGDQNISIASINSVVQYDRVDLMNDYCSVLDDTLKLFSNLKHIMFIMDNFREFTKILSDKFELKIEDVNLYEIIQEVKSIYSFNIENKNLK